MNGSICLACPEYSTSQTNHGCRQRSVSRNSSRLVTFQIPISALLPACESLGELTKCSSPTIFLLSADLVLCCCIFAEQVHAFDLASVTTKSECSQRCFRRRHNVE